MENELKNTKSDSQISEIDQISDRNTMRFLIVLLIVFLCLSGILFLSWKFKAPGAPEPPEIETYVLARQGLITLLRTTDNKYTIIQRPGKIGYFYDLIVMRTKTSGFIHQTIYAKASTNIQFSIRNEIFDWNSYTNFSIRERKE